MTITPCRFHIRMLAVLVFCMVPGTFPVRAEIPATFLEDLEGITQVRAPDAIVPWDYGTGAEQEKNKIFIPSDESEKKYKLAIGMDGVGQTHVAKALWNDRGTMITAYLNEAGFSRLEYRRRYGAGASRALVPNAKIQGTESICLTEPAGFKTYQWQVSKDDHTFTDLSEAVTERCIPEVSSSVKYYQCAVSTYSGKNLILGENYAVTWIRPAAALRLQVDEVIS